jgi:hypothetical protein
MRRQDALWLGAIGLCEMATMVVFLNYTAVVLLIGSVANVAGSWVSDRWGRVGVIVVSEPCSAGVSLAIGWLFHAPPGWS